MSDNLAKIRAIYHVKFPAFAGYSDDRFLRQPIGNPLITEDFCGPVMAREAIEEVAAACGVEIKGEDIAHFVTVHSLLDLVDDLTA
jgi:hypothetical protein